MSTQTIITNAVYGFMTRERYTQTDIAGLLEMNQTTVSKKLLGAVRWTTDDIDRLTVLGVITPIQALDITEEY